MSTLYFITGNPGKLAEVRLLLPDVQAWNVDLPEIQASDAQKVVEAKLHSARQLAQTPTHFFVEDTSLHLDALKGLPGPLIKWFIDPAKLGLEGVFEMVHKLGNTACQARTLIGYLNQEAGTELYFFEGLIPGQLVAPRGDHGFGWDAIFQPEGSESTFAQMNGSEKFQWSMRRLALEAFQAHLEQQAIAEEAIPRLE